MDAIEFAVNHHISLNGILLYGNSNEKYRYDVEIKVISASDISLLHVLPTKIKASGNILKIYFDRPCRISPHKKYTEWVKMTGSESYRGKYSEYVEYKGYKFKFYKSKYSSNGTSVTSGQIPGLLCYLK